LVSACEGNMEILKLFLWFWNLEMKTLRHIMSKQPFSSLLSTDLIPEKDSGMISQPTEIN